MTETKQSGPYKRGDFMRVQGGQVRLNYAEWMVANTAYAAGLAAGGGQAEREAIADEVEAIPRWLLVGLNDAIGALASRIRRGDFAPAGPVASPSLPDPVRAVEAARNENGVTVCPSPSCGNTDRYPLRDIHGEFINRVRCQPCGREEWAIRLYEPRRNRAHDWYTPHDIGLLLAALDGEVGRG